MSNNAIEIDKEKFSQKLKEKKITQRKISEYLGVNQISVSRYVNGHRTISLENALKICNMLDCTVNELWSVKVETKK